MPEEPELLKSPLHKHHVAMEARMGAESRWAVPLSYRGALDEVRQVRARAGVADVSHIGRIRIRGGEALDLLERICTADAAGQEDDTARLTLLCNDRGGIIDAGFLLRLENQWLLTGDAGNREKVLAHVQTHAADFDARADDQTRKSAMLSVAGPQAPKLLDAVLPEKVAHTPRGWVKMGSLLIARYIAMRTGCTGEWSMEVMVPAMMAGQAWRFITQEAGSGAVAPFGSAARDVLRIEAGLPRYGRELNETIDPVTAGLERAVDLEHDFLGRDAVLKIKEAGPARKLVGLAASSPEPGARPPIPRQGARVCRPDGREAGTVTSGTFSPTLDRTIALAYVAPDAGQIATEVRVEIGPDQHAFEVVSFPFFRSGEKHNC